MSVTVHQILRGVRDCESIRITNLGDNYRPRHKAREMSELTESALAGWCGDTLQIGLC